MSSWKLRGDALALVCWKDAKDPTQTRANISRACFTASWTIEQASLACAAPRCSASQRRSGTRLFLQAASIIALRHDNTQNSGITLHAGESGNVHFDRLDYCKKGKWALKCCHVSVSHHVWWRLWGIKKKVEKRLQGGPMCFVIINDFKACLYDWTILF